MIAAIYFDGQTTRRQPVTLMIHKRVVAISGDGIRRSAGLSKLDISERLEHAPRIMRLPDGCFVEVSDPALDKLLKKNGYRDPWVVRWQQNWPFSLLALISVLAILVAGYQWGLPWVADRIAVHMPAAMEKKIGDQELTLIDAGYMRPSRLSPVEQARLRGLFSELKQPRGGKTAYRLEFRDSGIGANAFALPNGVIVMTDQMVALARSDQAVLAVLAHELGHVQRRHSLRRLLQALGVGVAVNLFIGDVSTVLATVPTLLLDRKYSRDFERESDQYAIDMMRANGIPLSPMADLFEKMRSAHKGGDAAPQVEQGTTSDISEDEHNDDKRPPSKSRRQQRESLDYFSSHPADDERIAKLRAADKQ
jgi:Zn-dependent protease with chaperone function